MNLSICFLRYSSLKYNEGSFNFTYPMEPSGFLTGYLLPTFSNSLWKKFLTQFIINGVNNEHVCARGIPT